MPKLIGYMTMPVAGANGTNDGHLVKAVCSFCGKKYGSLEEARKCETRCLNALIRPELKITEYLIRRIYARNERADNNNDELPV